ncbi:M20/M25/M40 family metallo-hydrolase [Antarcticibacterium flavum]|uniref:M20/M25/M40 family metallo-hydrolase n=2 Tax=Flavobacteriaceae TaxID=49546 RepID=A0A5B7X8D0_9FLAO|nr:peptidase M28 [Antarcticibacterium sp. W02-3]QCY71385.1 M20/M25/M40 family metallo-hydrolase [Antarcticibacterium flavum]
MTNFFSKTFLLLALAAVSACNLSQKSTQEKNNTNTASLTASYEITPSAVKEKLDYLASNELQGRATGSEGIEKAAAYIEDNFKKWRVEPYFETYRDSFVVKELTGYNIVGYLEGEDEDLKNEFIILGAHYDHIGYGKKVDGDSIANGANDNAAGTVAVMELAKYFGETKTNGRSILFILFSAEEMGLVGAREIASRLKEEELDLYAMVNFEMIGVPMKDRDYLGYLTGFEDSNMAEKFNEYSGEEVLGFLPEAKQFNLFRRSDNYPFYEEFKVPAQTISTFDFTNYEFYHHVGDEAEKMDVDHMANLIEAVIPGITKMTNTPTREIKMN